MVNKIEMPERAMGDVNASLDAVIAMCHKALGEGGERNALNGVLSEAFKMRRIINDNMAIIRYPEKPAGGQAAGRKMTAGTEKAAERALVADARFCVCRLHSALDAKDGDIGEMALLAENLLADIRALQELKGEANV